jgi:hypothetical protein
VVFALHVRACIERGRLWQAEYDLNALRERALMLACVRRGLQATYGRGFDELPVDVLTAFADTRAHRVGVADLSAAAARAIYLLLTEARDLDSRTGELEADLRGVAEWLEGVSRRS